MELLKFVSTTAQDLEQTETTETRLELGNTAEKKSISSCFTC